MKPFLIFIVDDDPVFLRVMEEELKSTNYLRHYCYEGRPFATGEACLKSMVDNPDIVILDYELSSKFTAAENGLEILKKIKSTNPETYVIILSAQDNLETAISLNEAGADEYIIKNENSFSRINKVVRNVFESIKIKKEIKKEKIKNKIYLIAILLLAILVVFLCSRVPF